MLKVQTNAIAVLAGLNQAELSITKSLQDKPKDATALVVGSVEIYLPLAGMVDLANEKARLEKELKEAESHIQRLENLLGGDFANKAPAALVQKERDKLAGYKDTAEKIKTQLVEMQNQDGTWAGHHCITGRVAVTAAAILTLTVDQQS